MHVDEVALALHERIGCALDQSAEIIFALGNATNFDDLHRNGQLSRSEDLIYRLVYVVNYARHQDGENVVVANAAWVRRRPVVKLRQIADKLDNCSVVDRSCDLDRAQRTLIAVKQLFLVLDKRVSKVSSHGANVDR